MVNTNRHARTGGAMLPSPWKSSARLLRIRRGSLPYSQQVRRMVLCAGTGANTWRNRSAGREGRAMPRRIRSNRAELFHGLGSMAPPVRACRFVLTIHDVIYRHFPESVSVLDRWFRRWVHPAVARRADRVIVPSQTSANDAV